MTTAPMIEEWWNIVPGRNEGVTPLFERCKRVLGWDDNTCTLNMAAYREFFVIKRNLGDWHATLLSPLLPVDRIWHLHILDTKRYQVDCMILAGHMVHHDPDGPVDADARADRIQRTKDSIAARNGAHILKSPAWHFGGLPAADDDSHAGDRRRRSHEPDEEEQGTMDRNVRGRHEGESESVTLLVRDQQSGELVHFKIKKTTKMRVFETFAQMKNVGVSDLGFMFNGRRIWPMETLEMLEYKEGDVMDAQREQVGC